MANAGFKVRLHVSLDQKISDLLRAERLSSFIRLAAAKGSDRGYGASVANDLPVVAIWRFQSPVILGFIVGIDACDLHCAVREGVHSEFERDATV